MFVDQRFDALDLADIFRRVSPIVRSGLALWPDEPTFFIFPDAFLRQTYPPGNLIDQIRVFRFTVPPRHCFAYIDLCVSLEEMCVIRWATL